MLCNYHLDTGLQSPNLKGLRITKQKTLSREESCSHQKFCPKKQVANEFFPQQNKFPKHFFWGGVDLCECMSYRSTNAWTTKRAPDSLSWSQRQLWKTPGGQWKLNYPALQPSPTFLFNILLTPTKLKHQSHSFSTVQMGS